MPGCCLAKSKMIINPSLVIINKLFDRLEQFVLPRTAQRVLEGHLHSARPTRRGTQSQTPSAPARRRTPRACTAIGSTTPRAKAAPPPRCQTRQRPDEPLAANVPPVLPEGDLEESRDARGADASRSTMSETSVPSLRSTAPLPSSPRGGTHVCSRGQKLSPRRRRDRASAPRSMTQMASRSASAGGASGCAGAREAWCPPRCCLRRQGTSGSAPGLRRRRSCPACPRARSASPRSPCACPARRSARPCTSARVLQRGYGLPGDVVCEAVCPDEDPGEEVHPPEHRVRAGLVAPEEVLRSAERLVPVGYVVVRRRQELQLPVEDEREEHEVALRRRRHSGREAR